jgi:hypothetical protein
MKRVIGSEMDFLRVIKKHNQSKARQNAEVEIHIVFRKRDNTVGRARFIPPEFQEDFYKE